LIREQAREFETVTAPFAAQAKRLNEMERAARGFFQGYGRVKAAILRREYKRFGVKEGDGERLAWKMWLHHHPKASKRPVSQMSTLLRKRGQPRKPLPRSIVAEIDRLAAKLGSVHAACRHVAKKHRLGGAEMVRGRYRRILGQKSQ
jgi:hypothetical protein